MTISSSSSSFCRSTTEGSCFLEVDVGVGRVAVELVLFDSVAGIIVVGAPGSGLMMMEGLKEEEEETEGRWMVRSKLAPPLLLLTEEAERVCDFGEGEE